MPTVRNRKTIIVKNDFNTSSSFSTYINIDFIPDEVVVKSIVYQTTPAEEPFIIRTTLPTKYTNDLFTCSGSVENVFLDNTFLLNNQGINQNYTFSILDVNGNLSNREGKLFITLEFKEYSKKQKY